MGRSGIYNDNLTINWQYVNSKNQKLLKDFIFYCSANDKSPQTCKQYEAQLKVFFCWNYNENSDKFFIEIKKREFVNFFGWGRAQGWSPCRLASLRAVLSSFSNYIERILDEDYPTFKNLIKILEPIHLEPVREKTIIDKEDIMNGVEKLVNLGKYQYACFLALLFSSGMRKSEVSQMKVSYFFENAKIVFNGIAYETPKIRTKGHGIRGKQVSRYIFKETFDKYLELWLNQRKELGINSEYLFVVKGKTGNYKNASSSNFTHWISKIGELINIDYIYCHSLRHAFTTYLKRQGYPSDIVQKIQSWSSADLVSVYDDRDQSEELTDFFTKIQIQNQDKKE